MTTDDQEYLDRLSQEMAADATNNLLDSQIENSRKWVARRHAEGNSATLDDFTRKCIKEPSKRHIIIAAYCAALWRLMGRTKEDR